MRNLLVIVLGLFFALHASSAFAGDSSKAEMIDELVEVDGTVAQLDSLRAQMLRGIAPYEKKMRPDDFGLLQKSVEENFEGKALLKNYKKVLAGQIGEDALKAALAWFEKPLAKKFAQYQNESATPEGAKATQKLSNEIAKNPPVASREKLIRELLVLKANDLLLDLSMNLARGVAIGDLAARDETTPGALAAVRSHLDQMRKARRPQIEHDTYVSNLYIYHAATDDELREYIAFYKTKTGHDVIEASFFALNDSLQNAAEEVGREIGRLRRAMHR